MPSKWEFFGGTIGEVMVRKDPKNPLNKVLFINSPAQSPGWLAKVVRENGGAAYLVSVKDYDYPLIYKSSLKPYKGSELKSVK